jgi:hypothetical protein
MRQASIENFMVVLADSHVIENISLSIITPKSNYFFLIYEMLCVVLVRLPGDCTILKWKLIFSTESLSCDYCGKKFLLSTPRCNRNHADQDAMGKTRALVSRGIHNFDVK